MNKEALKELWRAVHHKNGWLGAVSVALSPEEVNYLIDLDDAWLEFGHEVRRAEGQKPRSLNRPQVDPAWAIERRKEYAGDMVITIKKALVDARIGRGRAARDGHDFSEAFYAAIERDLTASLERYIGIYERQNTPRGDERMPEITEDMIAQARAVPIATILGVKDDKKKVACPLHQDRHPSASISKGFLKCFSCGEILDSIAYLVRIEGYSFPDAIRRLIKS